jgi:hypothetical protein
MCSKRQEQWWDPKSSDTERQRSMIKRPGERKKKRIKRNKE